MQSVLLALFSTTPHVSQENGREAPPCLPQGGGGLLGWWGWGPRAPVPHQLSVQGWVFWVFWGPQKKASW